MAGSGDSNPAKKRAPGGESPPSRPPVRAASGEFQARMRIGTAEAVPSPREQTGDPAARARLAAAESASWVREEATHLLTNYRNSKYFKWKAWIVAAYAAVVLGSLLQVLHFNTIDAYVRVTRSQLDGKTIVLVRNDSPAEWTRVQLIINDTWVFERERLHSADNIQAELTQFRKAGSFGPEGRPQSNVVPRSLRVKCDQGSYWQSLN